MLWGFRALSLQLDVELEVQALGFDIWGFRIICVHFLMNCCYNYRAVYSVGAKGLVG